MAFLLNDQDKNEMSSRRGFALPARALLSLVLLFGAYLATTRAIAHWYFRQPPPEGLRKAIEWDPQNAMYYAALGRVLQDSSQGSDPNEVVRLYEKATQLSPHRAAYWADLGSAYEIMGRPADALRAYRRAQELFPNSPAINWQVANFFLRQGQLEPAFRGFEKVLLGDPSLRRQTFDLAWRATSDDALILMHMIPADSGTLFQYLDYLAEKQRIEEAERVWDRILSLNLAFEPQAAFHFLDALIQQKRIHKLTVAWDQLSKRNPTVIRQRAYDTNQINNGDFESLILNGGLEWRVGPVEGVVVSVDSLTFFDGTHSLKIQFDGKHNLDYFHIYQFVPVKPGTLYRFNGYLRAQGITTDSGPRFEVYDAYDSSRLYFATENLVGTSAWSPGLLQLRTGPDTHLLVVRIRRLASQKLENQIAGTVWVDRVTLISVE